MRLIGSKRTASRTPDYRKLKRHILAAPHEDRYQAIVDVPFKQNVAMTMLFLGFLCLYVVDEDNSTVQLEAASGSEQYRLAVEHYNFSPEDYQLDLKKDARNTIVQAIVSGKPQSTTDWVSVSRKGASPDLVRLNQANSGIAYAAIYPFSDKKRGAIMYNFYQYSELIDRHQHDFMRRYTELVSAILSSQATDFDGRSARA